MREFLEQASEWLGSDGVAGGQSVARAIVDLVRRPNGEFPKIRSGSLPDPHLLGLLNQAMDAPDAVDITEAFKRVALSLPWTTAPPGKLTRHMEGRYTFASIIGPNELIHPDDIRFGAFLVAPETFYPDHWHAAEEIYMILSGTAQWKAGGAPFADVAPGGVFRHESWQRHGTATRLEPMLALWAWHGDIRSDQYGIEMDPADAGAAPGGLFSVSPG